MLLICNRHQISEHSLFGERWKCKKCDYLYARRYLENLKIKAIKYGGGECKKCGYDKCWHALHFHHIDPSKKEFAIFESRPRKKKVRNWEKLKIEIDKCILLCANCHVALHANDEKTEIQQFKKLKLKRIEIEMYNKSILNNRSTAEKCLEKILSNADNVSIEPVLEADYTMENFYKDFISQLETKLI